MITILKSKLHRATVTESDLNYEGSITIDPDLMREANILIHEQVDVLNINNGERFTTYAIEGKKGSQEVCINGAAARLVQKGDLVIICTYVQIQEEKARDFKPKVVLLGKDNRVK